MSVNPAKELASLFEEWDKSEAHRQKVGYHPQHAKLEFWHSQQRALECLREIERLLKFVDDDGQRGFDFSAELPTWYQAVFTFGTDLNDSSLKFLRALAVVIDVMGDTAPLTAGQRTSLLEALMEADLLLSAELGSVSHNERAYVMTLVAALRYALSGDRPLDPDELKRTIDQLIGALVGIATQLNAVDDSETAHRFVQVVSRITSTTRTLLYDAAAVSAVVAAVPIIQKMIGS